MAKKYDPAKLNTDPLYGILSGDGYDKSEAEGTSKTQELQEAFETQEVQDVPKADATQDDPIVEVTSKTHKARLKRSIVDGLKKYRGNKNGAKLDRIGMAFLPEIYDFICVMSKAEGMTMTAYVNILVAEEMEKNGDKYRAIKAVIDE